MLSTLRKVARTLKRQLLYYRALANHPQTPKLARWCLVLALGYLLLPFDLIPDCIPVIGHLDDLIIVPGLIIMALLLIPQNIKQICRDAIASDK